MGLMNQVAQAMDDSITQEVTNHLFKKVGARFGMDLVSFNMQRGRIWSAWFHGVQKILWTSLV